MIDRTTLEHMFMIEIGDPSNDGHGRCDEYIFKSNYTNSEIYDAIEKAREITGVNIHDVCCEYEDRKIPEDVLETLKEYGVEPRYRFPKYPSLGSDTFAKFVIDFAGIALGDDFRYEETMNRIGGIGDFGYGIMS